MADDLNAVGEDTDLNGFPCIVPFMIHGVAEALFNGSIGIVKEAIRLRPVRELDHLLLNDTVPNILECLPQLVVKWSIKGFFNDLISAQVLRELDDVNLGIGEETVRFHAEKHQPNVLRLGVFRQTVYDIHAPAQIEEIHVLGFLV